MAFGAYTDDMENRALNKAGAPVEDLWLVSGCQTTLSLATFEK